MPPRKKRATAQRTRAPNAHVTSRTSFFDLPAELRNRIYQMVAQHDIRKWMGPLDNRNATGLPRVNRQARMEYLPMEYAARWLYFPWVSNTRISSPRKWFAIYGKSRVPIAKRMTFAMYRGSVRVVVRGCSNGWSDLERYVHTTCIEDEEGRAQAMIGSNSAEHTAVVAAETRAHLVVREDGSVYLTAEGADRIMKALK